MTKSLEQIQRELAATFFEEALENVERLESGLLSLRGEAVVDPELVNDVFRAAHSIKGGAGTFGFLDLVELGHALEGVLDDYRAGVATPTAPALELLLRTVDALRDALAARQGGSSGRDVRALCEALSELRSAQPVPSAPAPVTEGARTVLVSFRPLAGLIASGQEPARTFGELSRLGKLKVELDASKLPDLQELEPDVCHLKWDLELTGRVSADEVSELFSGMKSASELSVCEFFDDFGVEVEPALHASEPRPEAVAAPAPAPERAAESRGEGAGPGSIRVGVDKIDLLLNMVGELVITQSMLGTLDGDAELDATRIELLREGLNQLARNTRALQETVMRLRSVPVSSVFARFPRLVHDLGQKLGKQVELRVEGQSTEIDKTILEKLGDPLVHLVRNSLDHGLEAPEARIQAGKAPCGTLTLSAQHRGGDVVVEVADDGRGIDRDKVLRRGRELGLLAPDQPPTEETLRDVLFAPGFSTASAVTDVSGRGVGMDVVRRNIRALGGEVFLESHPGRGTRVSLRLPSTLAIIDGQLVRVGPHLYAVPLLSIVESVQVDPAKVGRFRGTSEYYRLRDELIPIIDLRPLLGVSASGPPPGERLMVVVEAEGGAVGLLVDELAAQQQIVVKSLETNYERIAGLSGATILGDGSVALILDPPALARAARGVATTAA